MSYRQNPDTGVREASPRMNDTSFAGPLAPQPQPQAQSGRQYSFNVRRWMAGRTTLERIGFWIIVLAASALLLLVLGAILPPILGAAINAFYISLFVGMLTLMNLPRSSRWANALLGRRLFPVLKGSEIELWRLAGVNTGLAFVFVFFYSLLAYFIGGLLSGLLVFGGLVAAGVFYNHARKVIIKP
jgi:hypothetical protein